jgi:phosphoribosylamine--glycine ligase
VKILVIDELGLSLAWCMLCMQYGHEVRVWFPHVDGKPNETGNGILNKIEEWRPHMRWADLIFVADNSDEMMPLLQPYHDKGYPIFGSNLAGAKLEVERQFGQKIFKKYGIDTLPSVEFKDYNSAIKYVEEKFKDNESERFVCKPDGSDAPKALSYLSKSAVDMIFMLERWRDKPTEKASKNPRFIIQRFQSGIEMAVGGWFGKNGWSKWFCENFEHKKHMPGDCGVNTGEMGTCALYTNKSKLADKLLKPLTGYLHSINYRGFFDMAAIIDKEGNPWPLEATSRPGWPIFTIQTAMHIGDPADWMLDLLNGEDTLEVLDEMATGIRVFLPDFPYTEYTKRDCTGFPIYNCEPLLCEDVHLVDAKIGKAPGVKNGKIVDTEMYVTTGDRAFVAIGTDYSVSGSKNRAIRAIKKVEIPNSPEWRDDIGERLEKQIPLLQDLGYATDWKY